MAIETIRITNDEEAFSALRAALANDIGADTEVVFKGWPVFKLTISGENFYGSIPTRIMPPIIDLQKEIYRIYSRVRYNTEDIRGLKQAEREQLELIVEIKPGSTEFITQLANSLNEIVSSTDMSSQEALVLLISVAGMLTSAWAWKSWLVSKEKAHNQDVTVKLSQQETERLELVTEAMRQQPIIAENRAAIDQFRDDISRRLKPDDQIKVEREPIISGERAAEIVPALRVAAQEVRLDGEFLINEVKFPTNFGGKYRFAATRVDDRKHILIDAHPDALEPEQIEILKDGGFSVRKVFMEINAKSSRGVISGASLVSINWPDEE